MNVIGENSGSLKDENKCEKMSITICKEEIKGENMSKEVVDVQMPDKEICKEEMKCENIEMSKEIVDVQMPDKEICKEEIKGENMGNDVVDVQMPDKEICKQEMKCENIEMSKEVDVQIPGKEICKDVQDVCMESCSGFVDTVVSQQEGNEESGKKDDNEYEEMVKRKCTNNVQVSSENNNEHSEVDLNSLEKELFPDSDVSKDINQSQTTDENINDEDIGHVIINGLYLGNRRTAQNYAWLQKNVKFILNAAGNIKNFYEKDNTFTYLKLKLADSMEEKIEKYYDEANKFIENALNEGSGVLIHCSEGKSRSITITAAFLMMKKGLNLLDAYTLLQEKVPWELNPNIGFKMKLNDLELKLFSKTSLEFFGRGRRKTQTPVKYVAKYKEDEEDEDYKENEEKINDDDDDEFEDSTLAEDEDEPIDQNFEDDEGEEEEDYGKKKKKRKNRKKKNIN